MGAVAVGIDNMGSALGYGGNSRYAFAKVGKGNAKVLLIKSTIFTSTSNKLLCSTKWYPVSITSENLFRERDTHTRIWKVNGWESTQHFPISAYAHPPPHYHHCHQKHQAATPQHLGTTQAMGRIR